VAGIAARPAVPAVRCVGTTGDHAAALARPRPALLGKKVASKYRIEIQGSLMAAKTRQSSGKSEAAGNLCAIAMTAAASR
jgi:hypothetical protein